MKDQLPKDWRWVKLGEVCEITYGKGLPTKNLKPEGYPVFGANGIIGFNDKYLYQNPQVLISCRGAYSGKINFSPPKCFVTNNSLIIQTKDKVELDKRYLFYSLAAAKKNKLVTGTAQPQVTINNAIDLDIPLPPKPTQLAIVSKIEELFSEIENGIKSLFTAKEQLKKYRQSVLKWAFEGKLTNALNGDLYDLSDEHDLSIAAEPQTEYRVKRNHNNQKNQKNHSSDKEELTEGWKWMKLLHVAKKITDGEHFRPKTEESGVPFLSAKDVRDEGVSFDDPLYISQETAKKALVRCDPQKGDILIVSRGATVGRMCIVKTDKTFCLLGSVILIKVNELINNNFLNYFLKSPFANQKMVTISGATAQQAIYLRDIKNIKIPLCSIKQQKKVVQAIESRLSVADKMEESITESLQQAEALKQSILKKAFEGRL
jgi:type I restriction enzyme S subunit